MLRAHVMHMLGDPAPAANGQLGFNPLPHLDLFGSVLLPMMLALAQLPVLGWGKGLAIDRSRFRNPQLDAALVALAGPLSFLFMGGLAAIAIALLVPVGTVDVPPGPSAVGLDLLANFLIVCAVLAVFNLLPIPGLDGSRILEAILPRPLADRYAALDAYALPILIVLVVVMPLLSPELSLLRKVVAPLAQAIVGFFLWGAGAAV
jgi:Zn-dependent protease